VKDGGKIRIICNKLENKNIKITVKDNGPGLTTDKIEQINANLTKMDEIKEKKVQ
jgi:DNA topoisomerase VI subunit B